MTEQIKYQFVDNDIIEKYFESEYYGNTAKLKFRRAVNSISIKLPFQLNEDVAALAGLMPDGSLIKDLRRIYFSQKKNFKKIILFKNLLTKIFSPDNKIFIREGHGGFDAYINSTSLARFFYHILEIPKSDEQMNIPKWIFLSPKSVKLAYLREAYAMEGTILKDLHEIRFITKDYDFAVSLQGLLRQLNITAHVRERIGGTHRTLQYRISVYGKENFVRFKEIGFTNKFHKERFQRLLCRYKI